MNETLSPITGIIDITSYYLQRLLPIIHRGKPADKRPAGGVLVVARRGETEPIPLMLIPICGLPMNELSACGGWALGKVLTLQEQPGLPSSWLGRDPEKDRWGGAILAGEYFLAFSRLEELEDEVLMVLVALELGLITEEYAIEKIMRPSGSLAIYEAFKVTQ